MGDVQSDNIDWLEHSYSGRITYSDREGTERRIVNAKGGVKADGNKKRPTLLLKSCANAVDSVIDVLEYGAKKYSDNNWKKVEHARYLDAAYRHMMAYTRGEVSDTETNMPHLAHAMCCILFMLQMDLDNAKENKTE